MQQEVQEGGGQLAHPMVQHAAEGRTAQSAGAGGPGHPEAGQFHPPPGQCIHGDPSRLSQQSQAGLAGQTNCSRRIKSETFLDRSGNGQKRSGSDSCINSVLYIVHCAKSHTKMLTVSL